MNKIQQAIHNKVNSAMGEVEYQTDCFIDGGYKSKFSMFKYLEQIKFKRKLIELMKEDIQHQIDEITSDDPQLIEGYDFMTKGQKTKYQNYLQKLFDDCDKYIAKHESEWKADSQLKRIRRKSKKKLAERLKQIEQNKGRRFRK